MQKHTGEGSLEMKIPNVFCVWCFFFFLKNIRLLSGQVIDAMVAEETEKTASCFSRNRETYETLLHRGSNGRWFEIIFCF